jgi:GTP:adenosylcobinamide-phosphate guanylyltransferase
VKVDAVILAGGEGEVIDPSCRFKGLVPILGRPLVEWVLDAFRDATTINEIAVVMPTAEGLGDWVDKAAKLVVSDRDFMDNLLAGVASFRADRPVLIATGDLPMLTGAAIDDFVTASLESGADITYPLIPKREMEAQFPGSVRTYFRLKSGEFTGGNMMLMNPLLVPSNREIGQRLFDNRKNALATVRIAGLRFAVKFVLGRLEAADIERRLQELLGGTGAAIVTDQASLAVDVDKPADVELVERTLAPRA